MGLISRLASVLAGAALGGLVVMTIAAVLSRYIFDAPFHWTEEISGLLMIWIIMVGAVVTERDDQHLSIPIIMDAMPRRLAAAVRLVTGALSMVVLAYCGYLGWELAERAQYKLTGVLQFSWFWIDLAFPVGAAGLVIVMAIKWFHDWRIVIRGEQ